MSTPSPDDTGALSPAERDFLARRMPVDSATRPFRDGQVNGVFEEMLGTLRQARDAMSTVPVGNLENGADFVLVFLLVKSVIARAEALK